jgi:RNA polymerase primary sigma factor
MKKNPRQPRDEVKSRMVALSEMLRSGEVSLDEVIESLKNQPEGVQQAAYSQDVTLLSVRREYELFIQEVINICSPTSVNEAETPSQTVRGISPQGGAKQATTADRAKKTRATPDRTAQHIPKGDIELEMLMEDVQDRLSDSSYIEAFLDIPPDGEDGKYEKGGSSRRKAQAKKKPYAEDSIRLYLQEISRFRLLRADEEIELGRKIADLLELERVRENLCGELGRSPKDKEWADAVKMPLPAFRQRLYQGRRAKDKMVQSNLRLVVSIARKYMNRGLSLQDLIQEGSLGLIRATEKFDCERGYKFSTYATWWIRQAITRGIAEQSRTIRLPVHLYETISQIRKTTKLLSQEMGRKPTEEEIATRMGMTIEKLRFIAKSAQLSISLETLIWKEETDSLMEYFLELADLIESDGETPEEYVSKNLLREDLETALKTLRPRERDVLRRRYGLDDGRMKSQEEIGKIFSVTGDIVREIEVEALRKLRRFSRSKRSHILKGY